ncbi:MAG: glycosyltransferase family 9 protein [Candidatus Omnitrophota bacterium]|nr:glycosyltransferase family 9 protein [Candidatus Omnitrophota bacterium]
MSPEYILIYDIMKVERVLIFELNWMGDILFSFPFLRAVRGAFPEAYITCTVVPRYVDLLIHNPWINFVHALPDDNRISSIGEKLAFIRMVKKEKYDTCFFLKPSRTKAVMAVLAGIPERVGFRGKGAPLTREVEMPRDLHRADQILALAGVLDVTEADGSCEYFFSEEDEERANDLLRQAGGGVRRTVVLNPGGNWELKKWPSKNFIELARRILENFEDVEVMVTGGEKDVKVAREIVSEAGTDRCYTVAGMTGLNELAVLFKESTLVISADSGPLHLASATGVTTIGLYGPTSHDITGPRGRGKNIIIRKDTGCVVPCYVKNCGKGLACMNEITVDEVFGAAERILKAGTG